jgi:gliding motility-associated-like protein
MTLRLKHSTLFLLVNLLSFCSCSFVFSQNTATASATKQGWTHKPFERKAFIENKDQLVTELLSDKKAFSYMIDNGTKILFYNNEVLFYFKKSKLSKEEMVEEGGDSAEEREREMKMQKSEKQFVSMKWLNANPAASIEVSGEQTVDYAYVISKPGLKNYTAHCKGYDKLKIKNMYPGIDVEYFFNEKEGFKYNVYISAGADVSQIKQEYTGAKNIKLINGDIVIKTIKGNIVDHAPITFADGNPNQRVVSSFVLQKNVVSFQVINTGKSLLTIDPWVTPPTMTNAPVDNGVDQYGNSYVTSPQYILEKYSPTGVLISSTDVMNGGASIFGDMLTDSHGSCFFNTVIGSQPRGDASAVDSAGNFLWDSFGINECWRFVLNECTSQVLSLTGYRHSSTGFVRINTETGALNGYTQSGNCCQDPHCGVIDYNGDVYCVVSENGAGTKIYKWTPSNTIATTYPAVGSWGYGTGYVGDGGFAQGYNGMSILGNNLYIYDGATLFKVNKATGAAISQVTVPGGVNKHNGGIYITSCGKIFVGSGTGVYMYDLNFNQIDFKSTTGAVYDLAFNSFNQTISVCGPGHVTELSFVIPPCVFQTQPFIQPSCGGLPNGYIKLNLSGGVPDYTYTWSSNGVPLSQTVDSIGGLAPGTYKCVYADNKCPIPNVDSIVLVVPSVATTANFTFSNVCFPSPIQLTDSSHTSFGTIASWDWKFGDTTTQSQQSPSHVYASDGFYNVQLLVTTSDGCKDSITKSISIFPKPNANFTFTNKCNGTAVPLNSTSTINNPGLINSWNWAFGDNTNGTGSSTTHLYASPGNYDVRLIVTSTNMCSDTVTKQDTVFNNPVAGFSYADVCLGDSMHFISTSTVNSPATISNYLWNFEIGGGTSTLQATAYKYSSSGVYSVTLVITTADGCSDASTAQVKVYAPPVSTFSVNDVCLFDTAVFINASPNPTLDTIGSWTWNYGDGTALNTNVWSPHHLYADTGKYYVNLITRTSILGCADTLQDSILVFPMPIAGFTSVDVCFKDSMYFNDISTVTGSGSVTGWLWNLGDASALSVVQNPVHLYTSNATFPVTLVVTTNNGCKDTVNRNVVVHPNPTASYSTANVCLGSNTSFTDQSTIPPTDTIQFWIWNYGDTTPLNTSPTNSHLYAAAGHDTVQLLVISTFGCKDSVSKISVVNPNPVVSFIGVDSVGCETLCVNFQDQSSILTGANGSWLWGFGDNNSTGTSVNPSYCYNNDSIYSPIYYTVSLTVTSDSGCVTTLTKNNYITVYPKPIANFSVQPNATSIIDPVIAISDLSVGANFWIWNYGDMDTTTSPSPLPHTYADTGAYVISLLVTTNYGCVDSTNRTITVDPNFLFYIPNSFTPNGDGINDTFTGQGIFVKEFEMFIYDRWGNLVFYSNNIARPWNGKVNDGSEIAQQDVYVYSIKVIDYKLLKHFYRGTVTLIR